MKYQSDATSLTKKLISIPSYVNKTNDESKLADFICDWLSTNTTLIIEKQSVSGSRCNIFAYSSACLREGSFEVDLLLLDHIDTVLPAMNWDSDPLLAKVKSGKIFGLGAFDTKSGVAVMMESAIKIRDEKVAYLFYIDEEYDFAGMKAFIETNSMRFKPKKILSLDGENLTIRSSCRGLFEVDISIKGKTGHAANPEGGVNAIVIGNELINFTNYNLSNLELNPILGKCSLNIASIRGGLFQGLDESGNPILGGNGNNIADYLKLKLEIRTNTSFCSREYLVNLEKIIKNTLAEMKFDIIHDFPAWMTGSDKLSWITNPLAKKVPMVKSTDASKTGYVDVAMLSSIWDCPIACIGVIGGNAHAAGEWVDIASIKIVENIVWDNIEKLEKQT